MKKIWITLLIVIVLAFGIVFGIILNGGQSNENIIENEIDELSEKIIDECIDEYELFEKQEIETNSNEEKISPNCQLTLRKYYKECNHLINEYINVPQELINKTQNDLKEEYLNWKIEEFSANRIVLYKEFESNCGQHFVLRNNEGKITIYKINENNEEELYENTEISFDYLPDTDKIEIQKGLIVNGLEALNELIENFE